MIRALRSLIRNPKIGDVAQLNLRFTSLDIDINQTEEFVQKNVTTIRKLNGLEAIHS